MQNFTLENIETTLPGVIVKVNGDTVDCKSCIRKVAPNGVIDVVNVTFPKVPLMKLGGANAEFTFPSKVGDQVLLVAFSRDSAKWKKTGDDDVIPDSATGLTLNDLVAVPFIMHSKSSSAKIQVTEDGDIVMTPADGRMVISESDMLVEGKVYATDEVSAMCQYIGGEVLDAAATHLSTHKHGSAVGPTSQPLPGS